MGDSIKHITTDSLNAPAPFSIPIGERSSDSETGIDIVDWIRAYGGDDGIAAHLSQTCVHHLFGDHAEATPAAVALVFAEARITYSELNQRANQLAHYLIEAGIGPEMIVGICLPRGIESIVAMLAVLKAGAAFLPLDPTYPAERLSLMLEHSDTGLTITNENAADLLPARWMPIICIDSESEEIESEPAHEPSVALAPDNAAYVIFTSGTTGSPKGVLVTHCGLSNLCAAQSMLFDAGPGDRVLQFASQSFDASVWEIWMALAAGATLCIADDEPRESSADLGAFLRSEAVTMATLPPAILSAYPAESIPSLRCLISAGDKCPAEVALKWGAGRRCFNAYGPTETTVCASAFECDPADSCDPPIGRPIINTELHILDSSMRPVDAGVEGGLF